MAVITQSVARADLLIHRGVHETFACEWLNIINGVAGEPENLEGDSAKFVLLDRDGKEQYLELICSTNDLGIASVSIPSATFIDAIWNMRLRGQWKMTVEHNGDTQLMGWGNYEIV